MWALIAEGYDVSQTEIGGPFEDVEWEETVALFTTRELAEAYVERNRLRHPVRRSFSSPQVFRRNSLLSRAVSASIEVYEEPQYPIDPQ